jgi:O-methyltransferase
MLLPTLNSTSNLQLLVNTIHLTKDIPGEIWECGVYKGGSASLICHNNIGKKTLRLFDTFGPGIPTSGVYDKHDIGDFELSYEDYSTLVDYFNKFPNVYIHRGIIPETFAGLEKSIISLCHIDLDQYDGYKAVLEFVYPRMPVGGIFMFDDYECNSTPGATKAVDDFCDLVGERVISSGSNYGAFMMKSLKEQNAN